VEKMTTKLTRVVSTKLSIEYYDELRKIIKKSTEIRESKTYHIRVFTIYNRSYG
jgi:hypothetical protein